MMFQNHSSHSPETVKVWASAFGFLMNLNMSNFFNPSSFTTIPIDWVKFLGEQLEHGTMEQVILQFVETYYQKYVLGEYIS